VVGTRGSQLACTQTQWAIDCIQAANPDLEIQIQIITTKGDRLQGKPLPEIGGKGLFTEELEQALRDGSIDLAVHSLKDLPTEMPDDLDILAYPVREDTRDAWISADETPFEELPSNSVVGTTSLRRQSQLLMQRKDLTFIGLRGNVDTRIKKVHRGDCAGALLAMAGLKRVGFDNHVTHPFDPSIVLPAPGQGALALEGRKDDDHLREQLQAIHHEPTQLAVVCERTILHELNAGCRAPVAIYARFEDENLFCEALVSDPKGEQVVRASASQPKSKAAVVVEQILSQLRGQGADEIIKECRQ